MDATAFYDYFDGITPCPIESRRLDGQPRQRHVALLGSVKGEWPRFWYCVTNTLIGSGAVAGGAEADWVGGRPGQLLSKPEVVARERLSKRQGVSLGGSVMKNLQSSRTSAL